MGFPVHLYKSQIVAETGSVTPNKVPERVFDTIKDKTIRYGGMFCHLLDQVTFVFSDPQQTSGI